MLRVHRRLAFRHLLLTLALGGVAVGSMAWSENAFAQMRTGREGQREFYRDRQGNSQTPTLNRPSQVEKSPVNKSPVLVTKAHSTSTTEAGEVVTASCKSCAQGIDHTHDAETEGIVIEGSQELDRCGSCGGTDGECGCDGIPHVNIRFAFPFARALSRVSVRMEAATFWGTDQTIPGLVRTGQVGTAESSDLFGGTVAMDETVQGYRGEVGWRLGNDVCSSIQVRFYDANAQSLTYNSAGSNDTSIVRPYFDAVSNQQDSVSIREPGVSNGDALAHASSDVYGGDLLLKQLVHRSCYGKVELLAGYQTALLTDSIAVNSTTVSSPSNDILFLQDRFDTSNRFHGGVLGLSAITYSPSWSLSGMFKLGMGNMDRYVGINGFQEITVGPPSETSTSQEGLLARSTNIGTYNFNTFVVSPEVNVTFGYRLTRNLEATLGYNYLCLPKVGRASDQIDPQLASNLSNPLTGPARPSFSFTESDFSLHSLSYGLQYRY